VGSFYSISPGKFLELQRFCCSQTGKPAYYSISAAKSQYLEKKRHWFGSIITLLAIFKKYLRENKKKKRELPIVKNE
jgi:hypothetical protein